RTIVNRLWAKFFGRGLVEPLDDMEQDAWHPALLDWLAEDLVEHGYDLKRTIDQMLTCEAYAWPAISSAEREPKQFVFKGPLVRRMSAEQFRDALGEITGVWYRQPAGEFDFSVLRNAQQRPETFLRAKWIWNVAGAQQKATPGTVYFRKTISVPSVPSEALAIVSCDNSFTLYLNGAKI